MKYYILFIFLLQSCLQNEYPRKANHVEPEFVETIELFHKICEESPRASMCRRFTDLPVSFGYNPQEFVRRDYTAGGYCDSRAREVRINYENWLKINERKRFILIFHELAHCILDLGHDDREVDETPLSLMNSFDGGFGFKTNSILISSYVDQIFYGDLSHTEERIELVRRIDYDPLYINFVFKPNYRIVNSERIQIVVEHELSGMSVYDYNMINAKLTIYNYYKTIKTVKTLDFNPEDVEIDYNNTTIRAPHLPEVKPIYFNNNTEVL